MVGKSSGPEIKEKTMNTKIDISSLDNYTQKRIPKLRARYEELEKGIEFDIPVENIKVIVGWYDGLEADIERADESNIDWDLIASKEDDILKKINEEIQDIIEFSDSCADRLGVDRTEFWDQYFAV